MLQLKKSLRSPTQIIISVHKIKYISLYFSIIKTTTTKKEKLKLMKNVEEIKFIVIFYAFYASFFFKIKKKNETQKNC